MSKKILLVGCGQLGSRHLQAISSLKDVSQIHVVDPDSSSIELGKARLKEISDLNSGIDFKWYNEIKTDSRGGDLCIIATQAKGRSELLRRISTELGYKRFLIEKIVSQSVDEYKDLMKFCEAEDIKVWVNCKSRAYAVHKYIKAKLDTSRPITFYEFGGNHGLATIGVHAADLFIFYDNSPNIKGRISNIDQILHPSKRRGELFELSGTLQGYTDRGSEFILSLSRNNMNMPVIAISDSRSQFIVDSVSGFALERKADSNGQWQRIPVKEENIHVSFMTKVFADHIMGNGLCELPTLEECYPAHEFILSELLPHFRRLLGVDKTYCPVT